VLAFLTVPEMQSQCFLAVKFHVTRVAAPVSFCISWFFKMCSLKTVMLIVHNQLHTSGGKVGSQLIC